MARKKSLLPSIKEIRKKAPVYTLTAYGAENKRKLQWLEDGTKNSVSRPILSYTMAKVLRSDFFKKNYNRPIVIGRFIKQTYKTILDAGGYTEKKMFASNKGKYGNWKRSKGIKPARLTGELENSLRVSVRKG